MANVLLQAIASGIPASEPGDLIDTNRLAITRAVIERLILIGPGLMIQSANKARIMHLREDPDDHIEALEIAIKAGLESLL